MAGPAPAATVQQPPTTRYGPALALLATLFFMWGFISVINGTLLPHLRSVFKLSYFQTGLIESVWFIGYLLASLPAAKLIERIGYQRVGGVLQRTRRTQTRRFHLLDQINVARVDVDERKEQVR